MIIHQTGLFLSSCSSWIGQGVKPVRVSQWNTGAESFSTPHLIALSLTIIVLIGARWTWSHYHSMLQSDGNVISHQLGRWRQGGREGRGCWNRMSISFHLETDLGRMMLIDSVSNRMDLKQWDAVRTQSSPGWMDGWMDGWKDIYIFFFFKKMLETRDCWRGLGIIELVLGNR